MSFRFAVAASLLLAPVTAHAALHTLDFDEPRKSTVLSIWQEASSVTPTTQLVVGDAAPGFSFLGSDGAWHKFSQLAEHQSVLLVFGATEIELTELDRARTEFLDLGIVPIVVVDRSNGTASALRRRLELSCRVISDPMRAIADLYNCVDWNGPSHMPSYFVLDEDHRIRVLGRGELPGVKRLIETSARGLGRESNETPATETTS
jgi:peroxiredoxin